VVVVEGYSKVDAEERDRATPGEEEENSISKAARLRGA
jgi:hypothetical protein